MGDRLWWKGAAGSIGIASPSELVTRGQTTPGSFRGVVGQIRWHYYVAADVHGYSVTYHDGHWQLSAQVVAADKFKMSQRPLVFVAITRQTIGKDLRLSAAPHEWRWPIESLELAEGGRLTATLGALEP